MRSSGMGTAYPEIFTHSSQWRSNGVTYECHDGRHIQLQRRLRDDQIEGPCPTLPTPRLAPFPATIVLGGTSIYFVPHSASLRHITIDDGSRTVGPALLPVLSGYGATTCTTTVHAKMLEDQREATAGAAHPRREVC